MDSFLAFAAMCHGLRDRCAMFDIYPHCQATIRPTVTISERPHLSVWDDYEADKD